MSKDRGDDIESVGMLGLLPPHCVQPQNMISIHICKKLLHMYLADNEGLFRVFPLDWAHVK